MDRFVRCANLVTRNLQKMLWLALLANCSQGQEVKFHVERLSVAAWPERFFPTCAALLRTSRNPRSRPKIVLAGGELIV